MYLTQMQILEGHNLIAALHAASPFGGVLFPLGTLQVQTCSIRKIELTESHVIMDVHDLRGIDGSHPLCINFAYRNFTFKALPHQFSIHQDKIICVIPQEAKALATRPGGERHILPLDLMTTALLHRIEKRDTIHESQIQLIDVSRQGFGAYIVWNSEGELLKYDHVWIKEINERKLDRPIFCRVEYVNPRKYKDNVTVLRVGLSTDKPLPAEVFLELTQMCRLVLSA